jgi:FdhE protein
MWDEIGSLAAGLGLEPHALIALADYAARPALRAGALVVKPLTEGASWSRGTCPACGAAAALSVRAGKEGDRSLFCARCGTGWRYPRVRCPACGEGDHRRLGALHATGEGDYRRADVCDTCRSYVKSVAALDPPDPDGLLRLDLDTAALDFTAIELGYHRHGVSADGAETRA